MKRLLPFNLLLPFVFSVAVWAPYKAAAQEIGEASETLFAANNDKTLVKSALEKASPGNKSATDVAQMLWSKVLSAQVPPLAQRKSMAEHIHEALNKKSFRPTEEGLFHAALGALHASDPETKYAALPMLEFAKKQWPELTSARETERLWKIFNLMFASKTVLDEGVLTNAAMLLDGPIMSTTSDNAFHFYKALGLYQGKKYPQALVAFSKVSLESADYRRAKFLEAVMHIESNQADLAKDALQIVISLDRTPSERNSKVDAKSIQRLRELGVLTMGRLYYEQGQFLESLAYYRTLNQESHFFYESLSEQGWAFFMAGYPNRALGAQYAAMSPFFADNFNPDSYFLNAILYYWMCEFDSSRSQLARFVAHSADEGDRLRKVVQSFNEMEAETAAKKYAKLFEDAKANVSPRNLGLGPKTVATILAKDLLSDSYEGLQTLQKRRLKLQKNTSYTAGKERMLKNWTAYEDETRVGLGLRVRTHMRTLSADFEKSLSQSRLLYLEILTAKKDTLLGKERSVKGQEFLGTERDFEEALKNQAQVWAQDKNEFWFDELGHYVFQVKSQCTNPGVGGSQGGGSPKK